MFEHEDKIVSQLWDSIEIIPGIINFSSFDDNVVVKNISESFKSISIKKTLDNKYDVNVAIIIDRNIAVKNLSKSIKEIIQYSFAKEKINLNKLNIFIKGVK